jgi:hypothetical protein
LEQSDREENRSATEHTDMKNPSTRQLFDYWNARRGRRSVPERAQIDPNGIRGVLADTFILTFEPMAGHPFRIAGTRVCALFGHELKGEAFLDLWSRQARRELQNLLAIVANEAVGVVASAERAATTHLDDMATTKLELLLLPLGYHGRTDARVLGALTPTDPASCSWAATCLRTAGNILVRS